MGGMTDSLTATGSARGSTWPSRARGVLPHLVLATLFLGAWWWLTTGGGVSSVVLPSPPDLAESIADVIGGSWFLEAFWTTAYETLIGFALAAVVGVGLGLLLGEFDLLGKVSQPFITAFQVTPSVALAPILIIWLGTGPGSKIALAFTISFFVILVNTMEGVRRVPFTSIRLMRSLRASRMQTMRILTIPAAMPFVFAGLRTGITLALVGALVGEFVGARTGLGQKLIEFTFAIRTSDVWAVLAVIGVLGIVLYGLVVWVDRRLVWWSE